MSLKYAVQKVSDNHYVLPKVGRMKVEAHAFLSEALYRGASWHGARRSGSSRPRSSGSTTRWRPSSGPSRVSPSRASSATHRHVPLDECAHVYKDLDEVLAVLEAERIARVANRLYPVANIKGAD